MEGELIRPVLTNVDELEGTILHLLGKGYSLGRVNRALLACYTLDLDALDLAGSQALEAQTAPSGVAERLSQSFGVLRAQLTPTMSALPQHGNFGHTSRATA